jgi:hypothetical protein
MGIIILGNIFILPFLEKEENVLKKRHHTVYKIIKINNNKDKKIKIKKVSCRLLLSSSVRSSINTEQIPTIT